MISLLDLSAQYNAISQQINAAVNKVIQSGCYILGPEVKSLEEEVSDYCNVKYGIGVASGTDAIKLSLIACGVKPGDEVITTPFSFIASADTIAQIGAKPVFVDINPLTFNIDEKKIEEKITSQTRAIVPVHLFGQAAQIDKVRELAEAYSLKVIEDCAQAIGAKLKGKKVGSFGSAGCLSFFPSKNLGGAGDGGMVITNDEEVANKVRVLRVHGANVKYQSEFNGYNSRLDEIQAAILRVKLTYLEEWTTIRKKIARLYDDLLADTTVQIPFNMEDASHVYNQYTIRLENRDKLQAWLQKSGINTAIYYPSPLHLQKIFKYLGYQEGDFLEAERAAVEVLSLPIYPELTEDELNEVALKIRFFDEMDH